MTGSPFSASFLYWVGIDFATSDPDSISRMNRFYDVVHAPEVLAGNPGFTGVHRYALRVPDERGDFGAGYLAAYEVDGERAASDHLARETGTGGTPVVYSSDPPLWPELLVTRWRVTYQRMAHTSEPRGAPGAVYIIGVDPPSDIADDELADFNEFYTDVHLAENTDLGGFHRGVRYELWHALKHPEPGCPRYLAVYELADATDESILASVERMKAAKYSRGPDSWARHTTGWRLWYRRMPSEPEHIRPQ